MGELFKEAEQSHLASHHQMNSWTEIPIKKIKQTGQQILDCMWVYTYKLNKHHRLLKCKARLVVRGDQQRNITSQDTYAATLASRSFRMLTAIAAKYDLELKQYDVANAFVHATIDREVFMRMPRGHQKPGTILKLNKALYGLRISPLLWQKEFTSTLKELGFQEVPHEPCCLIKGGIIIFFYVDDIILAYHKDIEQSAQQAIARLQEKYLFTGGNDLQWFSASRSSEIANQGRSNCRRRPTQTRSVDWPTVPTLDTTRRWRLPSYSLEMGSPAHQRSTNTSAR
ncbi:polyprotein [Pyrenophora tritici-repentis]|uniref:Polyprotein n=1 Tax=Pyrenophora tritici-repentis TaxID=45151 RepID=A0A922NKB2_9PLEO|nr:polyprotein [Pyrenophora tritici-repentis]